MLANIKHCCCQVSMVQADDQHLQLFSKVTSHSYRQAYMKLYQTGIFFYAIAFFAAYIKWNEKVSCILRTLQSYGQLPVIL